MPTASSIRVPQLRCTRCRETWLPKDPKRRPKRCAVCGSPHWDKPYEPPEAARKCRQTWRAKLQAAAAGADGPCGPDHAGAR
jgi:hypothetical protein